MITPVTRVGNPSSVARRPRSVLCKPAPSMSTPMPRSNGQFAVMALNGTLRPIGVDTRILRRAERAPRADFSNFHGGNLPPNARFVLDLCHVGGTADTILMKSPLHSDP